MISVCMATYNGGRYLREQVDSILSQLSQDDELIVSDDGSTDNTIQILKDYNDSRIKIFHNSVRHGVNANFENALRHAKGDYIFFSDQDDIWLPGKVNACISFLSDNCDCVFHDAAIIDKNGSTVRKSFYEGRIPSGAFLPNFIKTSYMGCRMAINRRCLKYVLPYPKNLKCFQEGWIASMIALKSEVKFIPFLGILYRRHGNNVSNTNERSPYTLSQKISIRWNLLWNVFKRLIFKK